MPLDPISLGLTGVGLLGSSFKGDDEISDRLLKQLYELSKRGIPISTLAQPELNVSNRIYGDEVKGGRQSLAQSGLSDTSMGNVFLAGAGERKAGRTGNIYDRARVENEQSKARARAALMQLLGFRAESDPSGAFGSLTSAGIQGLLRGFNNPGNVSESDFIKEEVRKYANPYSNHVF